MGDRMENECQCTECINNETNICTLSWIALDEEGYCLDKDIREE
jgi:hypothetical protein